MSCIGSNAVIIASYTRLDTAVIRITIFPRKNRWLRVLGIRLLSPFPRHFFDPVVNKTEHNTLSDEDAGPESMASEVDD